MKHAWYHEETEDHPIRWANGGEFTVGDLNTEEGMKLNIADTYTRWKALIKEMQTKGGIYLVEGCLYQNIIRYFIPGKYSDEKIIEYYDELMHILEPANLHIIYLYRPNVADSFKKAFAVCGKRWENIITEGMDNLDFSDEVSYHLLARQIFADYEGKRLDIDTSNDDWADYYKSICHFLKIEYYDRQYISIINPQVYAGSFEYL